MTLTWSSSVGRSLATSFSDDRPWLIERRRRHTSLALYRSLSNSIWCIWFLLYALVDSSIRFSAINSLNHFGWSANRTMSAKANTYYTLYVLRQNGIVPFCNWRFCEIMYETQYNLQYLLSGAPLWRFKFTTTQTSTNPPTTHPTCTYPHTHRRSTYTTTIH